MQKYRLVPLEGMYISYTSPFEKQLLDILQRKDLGDDVKQQLYLDLITRKKSPWVQKEKKSTTPSKSIATQTEEPEEQVEIIRPVKQEATKETGSQTNFVKFFHQSEEARKEEEREKQEALVRVATEAAKTAMGNIAKSSYFTPTLDVPEGPAQDLFIQIPKFFKDVPKTYKTKVQDLYRQLKVGVPTLEYNANTGQLLHEGETVPGAYLQTLLLDSVRSTSSFTLNPNKPGVWEFLQMAKDHDFPVMNFDNDIMMEEYMKIKMGQPGKVMPYETQFVHRPKPRHFKTEPQRDRIGSDPECRSTPKGKKRDYWD